MGGYLSQDEIDTLFKGLSSQAVSNKEHNNPRQQLPGNQGDDFAADRAVKKSPLVERVEFAPLQTLRPALRAKKPPLEFFQNITLVLSGELGAAEITVRDFLQLTVGSVLKLDKMAGEGATILLNGQDLGQAEVVVINDRFGLRVTAIGARDSKEEKVYPEEKNPPDSDSPAPLPEEEMGQGG